LHVGEIVAEGLYDTAQRQMGIRVEARHGRGQVGHHVDADGRSAKARLQYVGSVKGQTRRVDGEQGSRKRRQARRRHDRSEGPLVHAQGGTGSARTAVGQASQIEGRLE